MIILFLLSMALEIPKSQEQIAYETLLPVALLNYSTCLTLKASHYSKTTETVSNVVDAAFGSCSEFRRVLSNLPKQTDFAISTTATEKQLSWVDDQERKRLIAFVIDLRS